VETAGGVCVGKILQFRPTPDPRSFLGEGKVQELKAIVDAEHCDLAVLDNELSPSQMRALSEDLGVRVIDRSALILDIFAQRAQTREGRLQVELAQYQYLLPRLTGMWGHLVRQTAAGGSSPIGTRGPGETRLESDKRHIRERITRLREELDRVEAIVNRNIMAGIKVETIVADSLVDEVIESILEEVNTGHYGDGKIAIYPVEDYIRIRTGERGDAAL